MGLVEDVMCILGAAVYCIFMDGCIVMYDVGVYTMLLHPLAKTLFGAPGALNHTKYSIHERAAVYQLRVEGEQIHA